MSLNTQHIVAVETGVADVVDPLAGSYFVERLTNEVEAAGYTHVGVGKGRPGKGVKVKRPGNATPAKRGGKRA